MEWLPSHYFSLFYLAIVSILCFNKVFFLVNNDDHNSIFGTKSITNIIFSIVLAVCIIFFFGNRPATADFGDTYYYIHSYNLKEGYLKFSYDQEWIWNNLNVFCRDLGMDVSVFFTIIAFFYVGPILFICWRIMRNNVFLAFLFCVISFSFYGYGINGIRNGMACSIVLIGISLLIGKNKLENLFAIVFLIIAYFIHRSTLVPSICLIFAKYIINKPSIAINFWFISILISVVFGNFVGNFIESTGIYDEKMDYFLDASDSGIASQFSSTGFRWDFLLYSSMPVLMTWYITIKRNFIDNTFNILATTYILANSFWIMIIRATYSNRFAYLSWFLYPLIIAYPLIRMNIWDDQDKKAGLILLLYTGFTVFMFLKG